MADYSLNQLIEWMKEQPRTLGWGMICAFDRTQLNTLLTQEYIRRFKTSSYLEPISGTIPNGDERRFALKDFTLDRPRLSFENVDLNDSKARLRMRVVGGTQLGLKSVGGQWYTREIRETSPLQGPELSLNLRLDQVPGVVGENGELRLDLKYSDDFRMTVSEDRIEQSLVGAYFQQKFAALNDEKRVFPIGRIERGDNELLKPQSFVMRTQARRRTADDPEGAVLGFVRWEGDREGTLPTSDSDFRYLIPNDGGRSATVLVSYGRVVLSLMLEGFKKRMADFSFEYTRDTTGQLLGIRILEGWTLAQRSRHGIAGEPGSGIQTIDVERAQHGVLADGRQELKLDAAGQLRIKWPMPILSRLEFNSLTPADVTDQSTWSSCNYSIAHVRSSASLDFTLHAALRLGNVDSASVKLVDASYDHAVQPSYVSDDRTAKNRGSGNNCAAFQTRANLLAMAGITAAERHFEQRGLGADYLASQFLVMELSYGPSIRELVSDTLNLNFGNTILVDKLLSPHDVGVFGRVNPRTTSFVVSPLEHNLVAGTTRQFTVTPATDDLKWSVEPILASVLSEQIGTIDPQTGLYTAPTADSFAGPFVRLRVTATSQSNDYSSSALVTVLRNALQVNPVAYVMQAGAALSLEAGYLGEANRLTWTIKDASLGGAVAGQELTAQYTAPQTMPPSDPDDPYDAGLAFIADEVEVRDTASGVLSTAVVIVESATKSPMLVTREVDPATGSVQLVAFINGRPRDPAKVEWTVRHGPGTFGNTNGKPNGVYTSGPSGDQTFALLTATYRSEDDGVFEGYVLQPLPISELEAAVRGTGVYELANVNEENRP
ncbi:hypothetical protein ACSMEV_17370 [Pseudomonas sp. MLB6B]